VSDRAQETMSDETYLEEAARLGVDVEIERHDPWFVKDMLRELRALSPADLPSAIRAVNDGASVSDRAAYQEPGR
jgi:hypothetical protein